MGGGAASVSGARALTPRRLSLGFAALAVLCVGLACFIAWREAVAAKVADTSLAPAERDKLYRLADDPLPRGVWRVAGEEAIDLGPQDRLEKRFLARATDGAALVETIGVDGAFSPRDPSAPESSNFSRPNPHDAWLEASLGGEGTHVSFRLSAYPGVAGGFFLGRGERYEPITLVAAATLPTPSADRAFRLELLRAGDALEARIDGTPIARIGPSEMAPAAAALGVSETAIPRGPAGVCGGIYGVRLGTVRIAWREAEGRGEPRTLVDERPDPRVARTRVVSPEDLAGKGRPFGWIALAVVLPASILIGISSRGGPLLGLFLACPAALPLAILRRPALADPTAQLLMCVGFAAIYLAWAARAELSRRPGSTGGAPSPGTPAGTGPSPAAASGSSLGRDLAIALAILLALEGLLASLPRRAWADNVALAGTKVLEAKPDWRRETLRSGVVERAKPPGVRRVLCMGGSSTNGFPLVDPAAAWPARMEAHLRAGRAPQAPPFEVLNAGDLGMTTSVIRAVLEARLIDLSPDVVILYTGFNDSSRWPRWFSSEPLLSDFQAIEAYRTRSAAARLRDEILRRRTVRLARAGLEGLILSLLPPIPRADARSLVPRGSAEEIRENIRRIAALCRERGARLVIVPEVFKHCGELSRGMREAPQVRAVVEGAQEVGAPLVDVWGAFAARPHDRLMLDPVHPSASGHDTIGAGVAKALRDAGWLEK